MKEMNSSFVSQNSTKKKKKAISNGGGGTVISNSSSRPRSQLNMTNNSQNGNSNNNNTYSSVIQANPNMKHKFVGTNNGTQSRNYPMHKIKEFFINNTYNSNNLNASCLFMGNNNQIGTL